MSKEIFGHLEKNAKHSSKRQVFVRNHFRLKDNQFIMLLMTVCEQKLVKNSVQNWSQLLLEKSILGHFA